MRRLLAASLALNLLLVGTFAVVEGRRALHKLRGTLGGVATAPPAPVTGQISIAVDAGGSVHAISPLIYGVAKRDPLYVKGLGATLNRWGGNPSTRYNWTIGHAWNAGSDWEFHNLNYGYPQGSASDQFVRDDRSLGMASIVTVPAIGWVAKSDHNSDQSVGVPSDGGPATGPDGQIAGYDPTSNRARTSVRSLPKKPGAFVLNPDPSSPVVYQDEWVNHLKTEFGDAAQGGVRFYSIDNEPMLWSSTHVDVHPARVGYDELARTFSSYADAIKAVDPTAKVLGPESWGYTDLIYSELDRGSDNFATHADQNAHGGMALMPWFLKTVRSHDQAQGHRSLDVLSVHWYPQEPGVYGQKSNPALDALRLRSTRSLWDPTYTDESWIKKPVQLFPQLRSWIDTYYPGTKIGLTEYNFGGGTSVNAGITEAEVLGILGRENVDLATYWTAPAPGSPTWMAFRMFRNADGHGAGFGSTSVSARSAAPDAVSAFASKDPGWLDVMLINKQETAPGHVRLQLDRSRPKAAAQVYQYSGAHPSAISRLADASTSGGALNLDLPASSITLLRIPTAS